MNTMTVVCTLLAFVLVLVESAVYKKRDGCDILTECARPVLYFQLDHADSEDERVISFCKNTPLIFNCVEESKGACEDQVVLEKIRKAVDEVMILCLENKIEDGTEDDAIYEVEETDEEQEEDSDDPYKDATPEELRELFASDDSDT